MKRLAILSLLLLAGCTVVSIDRVFPKVTWYWTKDAKYQRQSERQHKAYEAGDTNWPNIK